MGLTDTRTSLLRSPEYALPQLREPPADNPRPPPPTPGRPCDPKRAQSCPREPQTASGQPEDPQRDEKGKRASRPATVRRCQNRVVQKAASKPHSRMPTPNFQTNSRISTVKCLAREFPHTCPQNENSNKNQTGQLAVAALRGSQSPLGPPCQNTAATCCANWKVG